ncbi:MAG: Gfo/Idh/MocA family oxidoreductase [Propionibacteriaceae bacterium]|jgi:predicted dehydrogenase|nr:Gfo/Idh/MocA family oxidoreductase [Propionibacteriaceae bacterium]
MNPPDRLRCAIVGAGAVAQLHAQAIAVHPRADLVAVTDLVPTKARQFAAQWGDPPVYHSVDQLLAAQTPDVVLLCTPPEAHRQQALAAFAAGAHVVVEKPPASSLDQLDDMIRAGRRAGRELAVVFQQRSGAAAAHIRGLLGSGALGRPLLAHCQTLWYRDADYFAAPWRGRWQSEGGGTTLGHGIHQIDLLAYLLGDWDCVWGRLWRLARQTETEDVSTATVVFANGVVAVVSSSAVSPRQTSAIRIDTDKATITLEHLYGHGRADWRVTPAPAVSAAEAAAWAFPDQTEDEQSGHAPWLRDVFDALLAGAPLPATASHPARAFEIVAAIYASAAADGGVVRPADLARHPTHRSGFASPVADLRPQR